MSSERERADAVLAEIAALEAMLAAARSRAAAISSSGGIDLAATLYRARRQRDLCFGEDAILFGEPAWDILLDLYSAQLKEREITISGACIASSVPPTTALRHLGNLETRGLVVRREDPGDARRSIVRISDRGAEIMGTWLVQCGL